MDNDGDINARPPLVGSCHPRPAEWPQVEVEAEAEQRVVPTAAYEWIVHCLECLAMGDFLGWGDNDDHDDDNGGGGGWEEGAGIGRAGGPGRDGPAVDVQGRDRSIDQDRCLVQGEEDRRRSQRRWTPLRALVAQGAGCGKNGCALRGREADNVVLGRTDLSLLPRACVDAARATFRDKAIRIQPRSSTGRRTNEAASKWEVLVHVANFLDLCFESEEDDNAVVPGQSDSYVRVLREAA
jgi:hypothetical protein